MPELPKFIVDAYYFARPAPDGENWIGVAPLTFGRGRIVRGPLENALCAGISDGW
jgi:hypothetical protein